MRSDGSISKQVIHDKLESQIKTAEAKLQTLKAQAETRWEQAKGSLEGRIADFEKSVKRIESKAS